MKVVVRFPASEFQRQGDAAWEGLRQMHAQGRRVEQGCGASLRILPDGTVKDLASSDRDHCLAAARSRTLKHHHLELKRPVTCTVEMDVSRSRPDRQTATVAGCEGEVARYALDTVTSFPWNSMIGSTDHYAVRVTLGPE